MDHLGHTSNEQAIPSVSMLVMSHGFHLYNLAKNLKIHVCYFPVKRTVEDEASDKPKKPRLEVKHNVL